MSKKNAALSSVNECLSMEELPSYEFIFSLAQKACDVLALESSLPPKKLYRPANCMKEPGSLLELYKEDIRELPAIIIPDIHARPNFIANILNYELPKKFCGTKENGKKLTVYEALQKKLLDVICVGDGVHTELYAARWELISLEFEKGDCTGFYMKQEMILNLATLCALLQLKTEFPENFHFLKGNHENILNCNFGGDYAFYKYADEGEMFKKFMLTYYDERLVNLIAKYENLLPLVAAGKNYVISHAEPAATFTREQLIDARFDEEVVAGLIWTKNGQVKNPTAAAIMKELLGKKNAKKALYFAGHRPVKENYALRQNGLFVQLHNPHKQNIALVYKNKKFNFDKDIVNTKPELYGKYGRLGKAGGKEK